MVSFFFWQVLIIDDYEWEPDETFFVKLHADVDESSDVEIGPHSIAEVTIINDDGKIFADTWFYKM